MKNFNFKELTAETLQNLAAEYHERGFVRLTGMENVTALLPKVLSETTKLSESEIKEMLRPQNSAVLSPALRQQLSKVSTTPDLAQSLLRMLKPMLLRLIGPIVHVSSNFHAQFKGGGIGQIGYSGFHAETEFVEIHGPHLLHQDFAAASLPISPSMVTLWIALNTTPSWNLRLYPGSHHNGVLCDKFLEISNKRLGALQEGVDIEAREGEAILFNGMMLHGTGKEGPERRASCDIRFFPFCGFLPSEAHLLDSNPHAHIMQRLNEEKASTLKAPLLQDLVFLGQSKSLDEQVLSSQGEPYSHLNWIRYIAHLMQGHQETGIPFLRALVNTEIGLNDPNVLVQKFKDHPVYPETLQIVREKLKGENGQSRDLTDLDTLIEQINPR